MIDKGRARISIMQITISSYCSFDGTFDPYQILSIYRYWLQTFAQALYTDTHTHTHTHQHKQPSHHQFCARTPNVELWTQVNKQIDYFDSISNAFTSIDFKVEARVKKRLSIPCRCFVYCRGFLIWRSFFY